MMKNNNWVSSLSIAMSAVSIAIFSDLTISTETTFASNNIELSSSCEFVEKPDGLNLQEECKKLSQELQKYLEAKLVGDTKEELTFHTLILDEKPTLAIQFDSVKSKDWNWINADKLFILSDKYSMKDLNSILNAIDLYSMLDAIIAKNNVKTSNIKVERIEDTVDADRGFLSLRFKVTWRDF